MVNRLLIWIIRRRKVSVLIGFEIEYGRLQQLHKQAFIYSNSLKHSVIIPGANIEGGESQ